LPDPAYGWCIDFENGFAFVCHYSEDGEYVADAGATLWAQDVLTMLVYENGTSDRLIVKRGSTADPMSWVDFKQHHQVSEIKLALGAVVGKAIKVGVFRRHEGCCLWWSLPDFFAACNITEQKFASRWINSLLKAWWGYLDQLGLSMDHSRQSSEAQACEHELGDAIHFSIDHRHACFDAALCCEAACSRWPQGRWDSCRCTELRDFHAEVLG